MAHRILFVLTLALFGACGDTSSEPAPLDLEDASALEDIAKSDVQGTSMDSATAPEDGGEVIPDLPSEVEDTQVSGTGDGGEDTSGSADTGASEVIAGDVTEPPDVGPADATVEPSPACLTDADCDAAEPGTADSCFANGVCFHDLIEACCDSDADCDQPASTCAVAICVDHGCALDESGCVGDEVVTVETLAGGGGPGHLDGSATDALFYDPFGFDVDDQGKLYVVEIFGATVRLVAGEEVLTVAGGGLTPAGPSDPTAIPAGFWGYQDGPALEALFNLPMHVAVDSATGDLYVADGGNHMVRKVSDGQVSTVAGHGILTAPSGAACDDNVPCP
ncbi:MAG: hypothetical protein VYE15_08080, partial [Myxococcota bacterium]|nr:hypothetical protein [Myxococcota bacterium]